MNKEYKYRGTKFKVGKLYKHKKFGFLVQLGKLPDPHTAILWPLHDNVPSKITQHCRVGYYNADIISIIIAQCTLANSYELATEMEQVLYAEV